MKKIIIIVCLLMLARPMVPVFQYIMNYDYIVTELCENKETPIMGCNGKCYLMKELAKASESEKPLSSQKKQLVIENADLFFGTITNFDLLRTNTGNNEAVKTTYSNLYCYSNGFSVFHPPTVIS